MRKASNLDPVTKTAFEGVCKFVLSFVPWKNNAPRFGQTSNQYDQTVRVSSAWGKHEIIMLILLCFLDNSFLCRLTGWLPDSGCKARYTAITTIIMKKKMRTINSLFNRARTTTWFISFSRNQQMVDLFSIVFRLLCVAPSTAANWSKQFNNLYVRTRCAQHAVCHWRNEIKLKLCVLAVACSRIRAMSEQSIVIRMTLN